MGAYRDNQETWRCRKWITLLDGTGTRVKGTPAINTKLEAERAERAHIERVLRGEREPPESRSPATKRKEESLTLSRFVEDAWWPKYSAGGGRRGVNSPTTLMEKEMHLRVHLLPALGELALPRISNEVLTGFFGKLRERGYGKKGRRVTSTEKRAVQKRLERQKGRKDRGRPRKGLSEKSVKNVRTTLRTILGFAVKWGYLDRMPEIPDVTVPEPSFDWYRPADVRRLLAGARDEWARAVLLFAVHTGVRMGEQRRCGGRTSISRRGSSRSGARRRNGWWSRRARRATVTGGSTSLVSWPKRWRRSGTPASSSSATRTARSCARVSSTRSCGRRRGRAGSGASSGTNCGTRSRRS
jgi:hypothetical protein